MIAICNKSDSIDLGQFSPLDVLQSFCFNAKVSVQEQQQQEQFDWLYIIRLIHYFNTFTRRDQAKEDGYVSDLVKIYKLTGGEE